MPRTLTGAGSSAVALAPSPYEKGRARLEDRVVLVSGGDGPIGRAIVLALLCEGASVAVTRPDVVDDDRSPEPAEEEAYCGRLMRLCGDVGHMGFCREAVAQSVAAFGRLDALVNNAAESATHAFAATPASGQLERTFLTSVFSSFDMTKVAAPHLGQGATVVNVALVDGYRGRLHVVEYTRSWAATLGRAGVRVNAIVAGPLARSVGGARSPVAIAERCVHLASEDSSPMTGQVVEADGDAAIGNRSLRARAEHARAPR